MDTEPKKVDVGVAGTSVDDARELISIGWTVNESGLWHKPGWFETPLTAAQALPVARAIHAAANAPRTPSPASPPESSPMASFARDFASSPRGTWFIGFCAAVVTFAMMNPPPDSLISPEWRENLKWIVFALGAGLGISQLPASMRATKK